MGGEVGSIVGADVGLLEGSTGESDGDRVGDTVVGTTVGEPLLGACVRLAEGCAVGEADGDELGGSVGVVGAPVSDAGEIVGDELGIDVVGATVGECAEGKREGLDEVGLAVVGFGEKEGELLGSVV